MTVRASAKTGESSVRIHATCEFSFDPVSQIWSNVVLLRSCVGHICSFIIGVTLSYIITLSVVQRVGFRPNIESVSPGIRIAIIKIRRSWVCYFDMHLSCAFLSSTSNFVHGYFVLKKLSHWIGISDKYFRTIKNAILRNNINETEARPNLAWNGTKEHTFSMRHRFLLLRLVEFCFRLLSRKHFGEIPFFQSRLIIHFLIFHFELYLNNCVRTDIIMPDHLLSPKNIKMNEQSLNWKKYN